MTPQEQAVREDLAAAYRLVALFGWDDLIFTHLTARVPGPDHHFLINPYDLMFEEMTASALIKIDVDGRPVEPTPYMTNPAGFTIHSAIHMGREDAHAVIHLHTPAGQAVSAMADGLMPLTQTAMIAGARLGYHAYEGIATDLGERERLVADLGQNSAMILRNHGTLTVGRTVGEAFVAMHFLERAAQAQVLLLGTGRDRLLPPPEGMAERVARQAAMAQDVVANRLAWPALRRKLDRIDPGYRA